MGRSSAISCPPRDVFWFPLACASPEEGLWLGEAASPWDASYTLGRGGWFRPLLLRPSCLLACTTRDAHPCSALCYPALDREEFWGPVACYTLSPSSHIPSEPVHPSITDHRSLATRRRAERPCTRALGEEPRPQWSGKSCGRREVGDRAARRSTLTFCIRESVSTMFFSTWSAFFCRRSMSSVSSLLEMLGRKRGRKRETHHPTNMATALIRCRGCPRGAVTQGVAGGQPSLPGTAAARDSLLPF